MAAAKGVGVGCGEEPRFDFKIGFKLVGTTISVAM